MSLEPRGYVDLPGHRGDGGFDHAAVHGGLGRLYLAHTANDAIDVIDTAARRLVRSVAGLKGVAGALVSEELGLVFTSNRGEDTVSILRADDLAEEARVKVGARPNGLAFASAHGLLLAANVGEPAGKAPVTASIVDVRGGDLVADTPVPGRTRWSVYDPVTDAFYVNIRDPPQIAVIDARAPARVARTIRVPHVGPHGLDIDDARRRLFCACDAGTLVTVAMASGEITEARPLSGAPDVIFYNAARQHLYVAIGDPGVIDVFDARTLERIQACPTEKGAHTLGFSPRANEVFAFLPGTHRAAVFEDTA